MSDQPARRLIDDCFLHDTDRLRHEEVLAILKERLTAVTDTETVALAGAHGRIAAETIRAPRDVPSADNAAVDGYAFAHASLNHASLNHASLSDGDATWLPVTQRIAAGHPASGPLGPGAAARIFTGALMPEGADSVAMQEDCETRDSGSGLEVSVPSGLKAGANRRRAGEDLAEGTTLIDPGNRLRPQDIAAIASTGQGDMLVHAPLKVAVYSSGDEIVEPGAELATGQVYDANRPLLTALLANLPVSVTDLGILPDRADAVRDALSDAAKTHDVVITTGGASRGEEDHLVESLDALGKRHLWQIAIKPGRPMCFGQIGDTVVFGLPGNPVAAFVCFLLYVRPALLRLGGASWHEPARFLVPAAFEISAKKPDRREFLRGMLVPGPDGVMVDKFARDGSGLISGLRAADGLIEITEEATGVSRGEMVAYIPFSEMGI